MSATCAPWHTATSILMDPKNTARLAGWLFIVTFVASIPAFFICYKPLLDHADYIRCRRGHPHRSRSVPRDARHRRQYRHGGRAFPDPQTAEREPRARLRRGPDRGIRLHRVGILSLLSIVTLRQDVGAAGGGSARRRGPVAGRDPRLDLPARARLGRRSRERPDPGLPDVPVRLGPPAHGQAGADRRSADHPLGDPRACSTSSSPAPRRRPSRRSRSSSGSCRSAST